MGGAIGCGVIFRPVPQSVDGPTTAPADPDSVRPIHLSADSSMAAQVNRNPAFGFCHVGGGQNCVVDGDTFWVEGVKVRIMDIDAPETHPPRCAYEADLGDRATNRLRELLNNGPFELESGGGDEDRYGRKLRIVTRNGESLGGILVKEGLAREWTGSRQPWC